MSIEQNGPGSVSASYGRRTTSGSRYDLFKRYGPVISEKGVPDPGVAITYSPDTLIPSEDSAEAIRNSIYLDKYIPTNELDDAGIRLDTFLNDGRSILNLADSRFLPEDPGGVGYYLGSQVNIPWFVSMEGRGAQTTFRFDDDSPDILFKLNTDSDGEWIVPFPATTFSQIRNFFMTTVNHDGVNGGDVPTKKTTAFEIGGPILLENIHVGNIATLVKQINRYIDMVTIRRVSTYDQYNPDGTSWIIDLNNTGDAVLIEQGHFYRKGLERPRAIRLRFKAGATIKDIIGGDILLDSCKNVDVSALHHEFGFVFFKDTSGCLRDSVFWMRAAAEGEISGIPVQIINNTNSTAKSNIVELTNLGFVYQPDFNNGAGYDSSLNNFSVVSPQGQGPAGLVKVSNLWRDHQSALGSFESPARIGVRCGYADFDDYSHITSRSSEYAGRVWNFKDTFGEVASTSAGIDTASSSLIDDVVWGGSSGTYYYRASLLLDKKRMIGLSGSAEKSFSLTNGASGPSIVLLSDFQRPAIIRLYRGTTTDSYDKFVDIPLISGGRLFDNGSDICGYAWQNRTAGTVDVVNNIPVLNFAIESGERSIASDAYGRVAIRARSAATLPTVGGWRRGDEIRVENGPSNPGFRFLGWRRLTNCTSAATSNTLNTDWAEIWEEAGSLVASNTAFQNIAGTLNTVHKRISDLWWDQTTSKFIHPSGTSASSTWIDLAGTVVYTPA